MTQDTLVRLLVERRRLPVKLICMTQRQERIATLMARCSDSAREYLHQLQEHERFPQLVTRLECLGGTIYQIDVEKIFLELVTK